MLVANNVQKFRWPTKSLDLNPIETQGQCTVAATKSQGAHACYSSDVKGHSTTVYSQTHFINGTLYLAVDATPGGCTKY